jgi:hypothetical protein
VGRQGRHKEGRQQRRLDVCIAVTIAPVAEVAIVQFVVEQGNDAVLRGALGLPDAAHFTTSQ